MSQCYDPTVLPASRRPRFSRAALKSALVARSPVHFACGDMRREYGWTRALLTAIVATGALALGVRAALTGLFVTLVSTDLSLVALFNVCVSLVVGRWLLAAGEVRPPERRPLLGGSSSPRTDVRSLLALAVEPLRQAVRRRSYSVTMACPLASTVTSYTS